MAATTPHDRMRQLIAAFNARDMEAASALYHRDATVVFEPGRPVIGRAAIRGVVETFLASNPALTIDKEATIESGDLALHCTRWSLQRTDSDGAAAEMSGRGAVVLRREPDGTWLVAVEYPWAELT